MKKLKHIIYLVCLVSCASDPKYSVKKPFFYEVKKDQQVGYFLGTIHIGVVDDDMPDKLWPYFDQAQAFASENDFDEAQDYERLLQQRFYRKKYEPKLIDKIPEPYYSKFVKIIQSKYPLFEKSILNDYSLYGANSALAETKQKKMYELERGDYVRLSGKYMLDMQLFKKAKKKNKFLTALDLKNQSNIVDCLTTQDALYLNAIKNNLDDKYVDDTFLKLYKLVEDYRAGVYLESDLETVDLNKCVLDDRNKIWLPKVISLLENYKSPFVAVGLAHLEGDSPMTLLNLLKNEGYSVRRLDFEEDK